MHQSAIVYHYLALYRLPIFRELMQSDKVDFTIYAGTESEIPIKKIDVELSNILVSDGGLRWEILQNKWLLRKKFLWQSGLLKFAVSGVYDSIIFLGTPYHLSTWMAVVIARLRNKRVYYWMHGAYKETPTFLDGIKLHIFYKMATGFFLYGNRALAILKKHKVKEGDDMHVIYNSLDYNACVQRRRGVTSDSVRNYRNTYFEDANVPVVVFIGRLTDIKRIDLLIMAQSTLKERNGNMPFNILLIGDGDERNGLELLAMRLGLSKHVVFFGAAYDEDTNSRLLIDADLCITPGEVGLTAIHALSYGTPVISHDNLDIQMPEVEAIVSGVTGDLYKYNDPDSLATVVETWLKVHPIKTEQLINNCFKVIDDHYNPNYQKTLIEDVLIKVK